MRKPVGFEGTKPVFTRSLDARLCPPTFDTPTTSSRSSRTRPRPRPSSSSRSSASGRSRGTATGSATRAKSHGCLKGEFRVYEGLPEELAQGIFREPKAYPVIVRFSTAPGELTRDSIPSFRSMALKLAGVPGEKTIPEDKDPVTQDFLLVNHPTIPTGTVDQYLRGIKMLDVVGKESEPVQKAMAKASQAVNVVANALGNEVIGVTGQGKKETGILDQTFFSMAALRYGDYVAKVCAAPVTPELTTEEQRRPTIHGDAGLRDVVRGFFQKQGAEYEVRVQLCTDLGRMPVEDGSIRWPEDESPYLGVARLAISRRRATATRAASTETTR